MPEVKPISAMSSAAVFTLGKSDCFSSMAVSRVAFGPPSAMAVKYSKCRSSGELTAASSSSSVSATSVRAMVTPARSIRYASSRARNNGMVVTQIPPAFKTANQQATSIGVLAARNSTLAPVTIPQSSTSTRAIWLLRVRREVAIGPAFCSHNAARVVR